MTTTEQLPDAVHSMSQRLTAEAIGTFLLVTSALLAPAGTTFAVVGLTLGVMVVAIGKVSGAQINPAVTTALIAARQFPLMEGLQYIVAQIVGAVLAMLLATSLLRGLGHPAGAVPANAGFWLAELLGAFILTFTVTRVVVSKVEVGAAAFAIGLALAIGIGVAGAFSGGVLNPAIALSLMFGGLISFGNGVLYLVMPLVGGLIGGLLARFLASPAELYVPAGRR
ncbi:aquaporin [Deinococcus ruber]|uniref:Aquaporin n=1 Tax=Deinococcus ruber TaxID=1848197 RepID=A0A918C9G0_9DEIO|nr:aquaporin [Deinococcus ruber]GGR12498.1 aquaporin [Deinococcus ruber]